MKNIEQDWRAIADRPGYEVSDQGKVRRTALLDTHGRLVYPAEIVSQCLSGSPKWHVLRYWEVSLRIAESKRKAIKVHHLVCEAFHGPRPEGLMALHRDGNRDNNAADNLYWGTQSQNMLDFHDHRGRKPTCINGHDITNPDNVYANAPGRKCKRCQRARTMAKHQGISDYRQLLDGE